MSTEQEWHYIKVTNSSTKLCPGTTRLIRNLSKSSSDIHTNIHSQNLYKGNYSRSYLSLNMYMYVYRTIFDYLWSIHNYDEYVMLLKRRRAMMESIETTSI